MKLKDLMVGDWIHSKLHDVDTVIIDVEGKVLKDQPELEYTESVSVWLSSKACWERHYLGEIEPIPLTDEILSYNGFVLDNHSVYINNYYLTTNYNEDMLFITFIGKIESPTNIKVMYMPDGVCFHLDLMVKRLYVHELQHILRMCGIKKEIVIK